jgi:hypothetical protein
LRSCRIPRCCIWTLPGRLDIADATGLPVTFSAPVLDHTLGLAGRIAVRLDQGQALLAALTGRRTLPDGWSIVG